MPKTQFDYARLAAEARQNGGVRDMFGPVPAGGDAERDMRQQKDTSANAIKTFNANEAVWMPLSEQRH